MNNSATTPDGPGERQSIRPLNHSSAQLVEGRHGTFLAYPNDFYIGSSLLEYGEFSELEVAVYRQLLGQGQHVVEVGANIGALTVALAQLVGPQGQVSAFEPQPNVFKLLNANLALNELWHVQVFQAAVGREAGMVEVDVLAPSAVFNIGSYRVLKEVGEPSLSPEATPRTVAVPLVTLDAWSVGQRPIDFIKIDAEGMELDVLKGAEHVLRKHRPLLQVENELASRSPELLTYLFEMHYRCYWSVTTYYNPGNFFGNPHNPYQKDGCPICSHNMICVPAEVAQALVEPEILSPNAPHPLPHL